MWFFIHKKEKNMCAFQHISRSFQTNWGQKGGGESPGLTLPFKSVFLAYLKEIRSPVCFPVMAIFVFLNR